MCQLTRRNFLRCSAMLAPMLTACAGDIAEPNAPDNDGVEILPGSIRIALARSPSLTKPGGSLVVPQAHVIVIRAADADYRAFTNVCTHAGCGIYAFVHPRIRCQCHGSEFDLDGLNVAGPAPTALKRFDAQLYDSGILVVAYA